MWLKVFIFILTVWLTVSAPTLSFISHLSTRQISVIYRGRQRRKERQTETERKVCNTAWFHFRATLSYIIFIHTIQLNIIIFMWGRTDVLITRLYIVICISSKCIFIRFDWIDTRESIFRFGVLSWLRWTRIALQFINFITKPNPIQQLIWYSMFRRAQIGIGYWNRSELRTHG